MTESDDRAITCTCWHCGALVPLGRVKVLGGERVVVCPKCGRTNSLDRVNRREEGQL